MLKPRSGTQSVLARLRRPDVRARLLPLGVVLLALAVQVSVLVHLASGRWFVGDDWDFLMTRGTVPGHSRGWFAPHAEHWSTGVIAIYRGLFAVFGMRDYLPYGLVVIVLHVAICLVLYRLLVRAGAGRWPAAATVWVIIFLGSAAEALLWDTPMNLLASLLLGLLALLVCLRADLGQRDVADAWVLLTLSMAFSGAGLTATAVVAAFVALSRGPRPALRVAIVPTLVFLVWFVAIGHEGSQGLAADKWQYLEMPLFVWTGLTHAMQATSGIAGAGAVLLLALVAAAGMSREVPRPLRDLALAGIAAAVLQLTLAASTPSRLDLRETWALLGRYVYLTMVLFAPAVAIGTTVLVRRVRAPRWFVAVGGATVLAMVAANGVHQERDYYLAHRAEARYWPARMQGILEADDQGQKILTLKPADWFDKGVDPRLVVTPQIRAALPADQATPKGRLDAERNFYTGVGARTYGLFNPATVDLVYGWNSPIRPGEGCASYTTNVSTPLLELQTDQGNEIGVFSESTSVTTQLVRDGVKGAQRVWRVKPGTVHIASSAKDATLVVTFDKGGDYLICKH